MLLFFFQNAKKEQGKRSKSDIIRDLNDNMSIAKVRQLILHLNPKSGEKAIFDHVDCSKLPQNPDAGDKSTSVAGGDLLAAMFGTADDEDENIQGDIRYRYRYQLHCW